MLFFRKQIIANLFNIHKGGGKMYPIRGGVHPIGFTDQIFGYKIVISKRHLTLPKQFMIQQ